MNSEFGLGPGLHESQPFGPDGVAVRGGTHFCETVGNHKSCAGGAALGRFDSLMIPLPVERSFIGSRMREMSIGKVRRG